MVWSFVVAIASILKLAKTAQYLILLLNVLV
jgi:hypothetical protein